MAESASGKIKPNPMFWLATGMGNMGLGGFPTLELQENSLSYYKFFMDQVSLVKMAGLLASIFCLLGL